MKTYYVCTPWGLHRSASIKIKCTNCPTDIAMNIANMGLIKKEEAIPICPTCASKISNPAIFAGIAIGGKVYEDPEEARKVWKLHQTRN